MSQAGVARFVRDQEQSAGLRIASVLHAGIFGALLGLVVLTAIPYGTAEQWWKATFVCLVFILSVCAILEGLLSGFSRTIRRSVLFPLIALSAFAFLQSIPLAASRGNPGNLSVVPWNAVSADPYQTRFVALQFLALAITLLLLYRYASNDRRIHFLISVVIGVALVSALLGILRQTTQHKIGFVLPLMVPGRGYGQFVNKNHFAFLMEMAFGLGLGLVLAGGVKRERVMIYCAALLPIWTGLVLSNSRGGILAMMAQFLVAALLFSNVVRNGEGAGAMRFSRFARSVGLRIVLLTVLLAGLLFGTLWVGGDRLTTSLETVRGELNPAAAGSHEGATRNEIWRATWRMFEAHPILGVGLGGYWIAITAYHDASGTLTPQEAHNEYLELLSSGGLVGLAIGVWFALAVFQSIRENLKSASRYRRAACFGAALGIAGVAVHSLVDFGLHLIANALVFVVLIMIATARIDSKEAGLLKLDA